MEKQSQHLRKTLFLLGGVLIAGATAPLRGAPTTSISAQQLAQASFVTQNKSEVERLRRTKIGWSALRVSMLHSGASATEVAGVLKRSRWAMKHIPIIMPRPSVWPIFARRQTLGVQPVWIVEAAAPATNFGYCPTGMTPQEIARIEARDPERCFQSVIIIQAHSPFKILARYDTAD
jgi:hypothetical protein